MFVGNSGKLCLRVFIVCVLCLPLSLIAHGGHEEILAQINKDIEKNGATAALLIQRGHVYLEHGQIQAAAADFITAQALNPQATDYSWLMAQIAYTRGQHAEALVAVTVVLQRNPRQYAALKMQAQCYEANEQWAQAAASWKMAIAVDEQPSPDIILHWAAAHMKNNDSLAALAALDVGIQRLGPIPVLVDAAVAQDLQLQQTAQAIKRLSTMIDAVERPERWLLQRAAIYKDMGNVAQAQQDYQLVCTGLRALPEGIRQRDIISKMLDVAEQGIQELKND